MSLNVFIGYDDREHLAFEVAAHSITRHASIGLDIVPLNLAQLTKRGIFYRDHDPLAATQFTYTRFIVPYLCNYMGHALYFDCDFLWTTDVAKLLDSAKGEKAVWCVHHDHQPTEITKMDGAIQTRYPRKNWSSLMLFNCQHEDTRKLTVEKVNAASGVYLHRMQWADDKNIGELPETWNWLEGHSPIPQDDRLPAAIHYTRGGPWFENRTDVTFADAWLRELALIR
jgi:lipopolysaccharide biosynthesis glycosyltransferase